MLLMYGQCYQSRYHNAQRVRRAISRETPFWAASVINLVERRNRQDRTQNFIKQ
jgi:hypothetical protein